MLADAPRGRLNCSEGGGIGGWGGQPPDVMTSTRSDEKILGVARQAPQAHSVRKFWWVFFGPAGAAGPHREGNVLGVFFGSLARKKYVLKVLKFLGYIISEILMGEIPKNDLPWWGEGIDPSMLRYHGRLTWRLKRRLHSFMVCHFLVLKPNPSPRKKG